MCIRDRNINNPQWIDVFDCEDRLIRHVDVPKPVSYTHLDVYKRQRVFKIGRDDKGERLTYMKVTGGVLKLKDVLLSLIHI